MRRNCSKVCAGLAGGGAIDAEAAAFLRVVAALLGEAEGAQEDEEIGRFLLAEEIGAVLLHLLALGAAQEAAALGEGGDEGDGADAAALVAPR